MPTRSGRDYSLFNMFSKFQTTPSNDTAPLVDSPSRDARSPFDIVTNRMMKMFDQLESNLNSRLNQMSLSSSLQTPTVSISNSKQVEPTDQIQNTPSLVLSSSNLSSNTLPTLAAISKHKWPTFSGDISTFLEWKAQFLAILCASELAPLYDDSVDDLIQPTTRNDVRPNDIQLYSRIIAALPTNNSFIGSSDYRSKGLALWHALTQEHESTGSYSHLDHLLSSFYSSTFRRENSESIDSYWNRYFNLVKKIQLDPKSPPFSNEYVRKRFITTLGSGFEFIVEDANNERLSPSLLICSDEELKINLRKIHMNKTLSSSSTATVSSFGYAHAAIAQKQEQAPDKIQTCLAAQDAKLDAITNMFIAHTESLNKCIAALSQTKQQRLKYCWTQGENHSHKSHECKTPGTGHQMDATWKNRKNGSDKSVKKE